MEMLIGGLIAGLVVGSLIAWLWLRKSLVAEADREIAEQRERNAELSARNEMLEQQIEPKKHHPK